MDKYLPAPCPRSDCGKTTMNRPTTSGTRLYSFCDSCKRKSLYVVHDKVDGSKSFSLVPIGKAGNDMVRKTFWITTKQASELVARSSTLRRQSEIVRRALDKELGIK